VPDALGLLRVAGEHALPLPLAETMLAGWLLAAVGLEVPDGPLTVAPAAAGETLQLAREGSGWRLDGLATRVPWGRVPGIGAAVLAGDQVAYVPPGGFEAQPGENLAREPRDTLRFSCVLPDRRVRPAAEGLGPERLRAVGAAMRSLQMAGALVTLVETTTQYAQDRVQFGRPIGKFQAIQHSLAVMATQAAAADLGAEAVADGVRLLPIAAAKARTGEAAGIATGLAHQIHGAIGFTYEHHLHFFSKRLWSWRDEFGNEAAWNLFVGRHLAGTGADRLWAEITAA